MKKVVILAILFAMTSLATAGLQIRAYNPDGTPWDGSPLKPSETLIIQLEGVGGNTGDSLFGLAVNTNGATLMGGGIGPDAPDATSILGNLEENVVGGIEGLNGIVGSVAAFVAQPPYSDGVMLNEIVFHCEAPYIDGVIQLVDIGTTWDIPTGRLMHELVIPQVPEPMTMALLGLGGLFLRRRK